MKYTPVPSSRFQKDVKRMAKWGFNMQLLTEVIRILANGDTLPLQYHDHSLSGQYSHCRECHITPDWLLIYEIEHEALFLYLTRTGTHSDLF